MKVGDCKVTAESNTVGKCWSQESDVDSGQGVTALDSHAVFLSSIVNAETVCCVDGGEDLEFGYFSDVLKKLFNSNCEIFNLLLKGLFL